MNCEKVKESIETFHDGAINGASGILVENHLTNCSSCAAELNRLQSLRKLLQNDIAPIPSAALDRKLMRAFLEKHERPAKSPAWWSTIFAGSISVPKPAFAAALIVIAAAITAANLIGRNAAVSSGSNTASTAPAFSSQMPSPQVIENTKIVEVPVIQQRILTRVVYIERPNQAATFKTQPNRLASAARNLSATTAKLKKGFSSDERNDSGLAMNGSVGEKGYFTSGNLTGFQPTAELKTRIIEEKK